MKNKDIKKMTEDELKTKINSFKKDLFNFRFRKIKGQIEDPSQIRKIKRDVAKILTKINKKKLI